MSDTSIVEPDRAGRPAMRKITTRDWLALIAPIALIFLTGAKLTLERGWLVGAVPAESMAAFTLWYWQRRIRTHPEATWQLRL